MTINIYLNGMNNLFRSYAALILALVSTYKDKATTLPIGKYTKLFNHNLTLKSQDQLSFQKLGKKYFLL